MHLLVIPSWYPNSQTDLSGIFFQEQSIAMREAGCDVGVLSYELRSSSVLKDWLIFPRFSFTNEYGLNVLRLTWINWLLKPKFIKKAFIEFFGLIAFEKYTKKYGRPDIIHVHSIFNAGFLAYRIWLKYKIPFVITEHSTGYHKNFYSKEELALASKISSVASGCFAVSTPFATLLKCTLLNSVDWQIHPNSVNDAFFETPIGYLRHQSPFTFITISNLIPRKNISLVITAFAKAFVGNENVRLKIGGDGDELASLKKMVSRLNIKNQVDFLGKLNRLEVINEINVSEVYVSGCNYETFGVVFIESMALGKPIIACKCGGSEDIIVPEVGVLIEQEDWEGMSNAMKRVYQGTIKFNPNDIRQICKNKYSAQSLSLKMIEHYKSILKFNITPL